MKDVLYLNLKREYFAKIAAGTKRIEYRKRTPYYAKRLEGRTYETILFRNGYATKAPEMVVEFRGLRRTGTARKGEYQILLGRVIRIKRWKA